MPAANTTYVAQWSVNSYAVTFDATGGSVSPTSKSVTYDSTYGELPTPEWPGHTFDGWYTSADGGAMIESATKVSITVSQTLYAHWTEDAHPDETITWYVNGTTGNDSNDGTSEASPKATIQAAIDAAIDGDTILVAAGTYNERIEISKCIEVKAISGPQFTAIHGEAGYAVARIMETAPGTVVDGFEITGGTGEPNPSSYGHDYYGGGVRCRTSATIRNCIIHGNGHGTPRTDSGTFGGGISSAEGSVLVENCLLYDNFAWASGGAVFVESEVGEMTLVNSTLYGNDSTDFFGYQGGVGLANGGKVNVYNCIVWGNGGNQIDAYSNIYSSGTMAEVAYSCVQGGVTKNNIATLNIGAGNVSAAPNFVDAANGDYRLAADSPCIAAGDNSYVTTTADLAGNTRIVNGTVDIGCYEYISLTNGLVAYYPFNGNANDASGNGNHLSNAGNATLSTGHDGSSGGACYFDGSTNSKLQMDPPLVVSNNFSFALWIKTSVAMSSHGESRTAWNPGNDVIHSGFADYGYVGVGLRVGTDGLAIVEHGGMYRPTVFSFSCDLGSDWHHVAVVVTAGSGEVVYLDGQYVGTAEINSGCLTDLHGNGMKGLRLDGDGMGGGTWGLYTGSIDDLCIYNRALSAAEVKALYDETAVPPQTTTHTVTFDPNGGSIGAASATREVEDGKAIGALPSATREGYALSGWYTAANGGEQVTAETIVTGDVTCYAHWTEDETEPDNHGKVQLWAGGLYWAETNIGAEKPEDCGYYFWWGDTVGCERVNGAWVATDKSSNFSFGDANTPTCNKSIATLKTEGWITAEEVLAPEHDAALVQWGGNWRMPTKQDFDDLKNNCDFTWTTVNGVKGYLVSGKGDYSSNSIFLPCAGYGTGSSHNNVSYGYYLSSVPCSDGDSYSWHFNFGPSYRNTYRDGRSAGNPIRPVQGFSDSPHPVTITFNANGGSVSPETRTVTSVSEVGRLPIPRRSGQSFAGWFTAVDGGSPIGENMVASSDVTYYAHWSPDGGEDSMFTEQANGYMWTYRIVGSTAEICGVDGSVAIWPNPVGAVDIPSSLGGCPVTCIGESAFSGCRNMTSVTIPDCVTDIGYSAFENCDELMNVVIPDYVTSIGDFAFDGCDSLTSVTIPDSVVSLGQCVFRGCDGLKNAVLGSGVANIDEYAFSGCYQLMNVTIGVSVTNIGVEAFSGCQSLTGVEIPDSVVSIGESAFSGCSGLTSVTIPYGVTTIGINAFFECSGLTSVMIPGSLSHIGECLFCKCESLADVTIGEGVESIGCQAFSECIGLESITIPDSMISIADYAFEYCSALRSVSLPGTLMDRVNPEAFYESSNVVITYRDEDTDPHGKVQLWEGGPYWATTNIGAENPEDYGYYFWWGDTVGYKREGNAWVATDGSSSNFSFNSGNTPTYGKSIATLQSEGWITADSVLAPAHDAAHVHWGGEWRMPTKQELSDLNSKCDWTWATQNGVQGYVVKGKGTYASASIFLPCAGSVYGYPTSLYYAGSYGFYWSSVPFSDKVCYDNALDLFFDSGDHHTYADDRMVGQSVRPVQGFTE